MLKNVSFWFQIFNWQFIPTLGKLYNLCGHYTFFLYKMTRSNGFLGGSGGKESAFNEGNQVQSLSWEDLLEKGMTTHSRILAWRTPWTEELAGYSPCSHKVRHN